MQVQPTVLGIAHPTGYPTYLLLGHIAELLPLGSVAFRANLLSAVLVAGTAAATVLIAVRLGIRPAAGAAAALVVAVTGTVWAAATVAEVNPLHLFLVALLVHRALVWSADRRPIDLALGGVLLGLALGNHLLTVTVAPFIALFVAWTGRRELIARPWLVLVAAAAVLGGLAVYLYIPIRAAMDPPLAYNHPTTLDDVIWLVTGRQFRDQFDFLSPVGPGRFVASLPTLAGLAVARATAVVPLLGVAGLVALGSRRPLVATLLGAILLIDVYVWANYLRLEHYLLVPWLVVAIGVAAALDALATGATRVAGRLHPHAGGDAWATAAVAGLGAILAVAVGAGNFAQADRSDDRSGDAYVDRVLAALPPNAVILSEWDASTPLWYAQHVEGRRPDVSVIDDSNIVYDGWGTREKAIAAFVCTRPVFILRLDEGSLAPTRAAFTLRPAATVPVAIGTPTAVAQRVLYLVEPPPPGDCPG